MFETRCPDRATLAAYRRGELPEADAAAVNAHLNTACPGCKQALFDLEREDEAIMNLLRPGAQPTAPSHEHGDRFSSGEAIEAGTVVARRYKLLEAIGHGGMGAVWMAQQIEPVKRLVALKLIKDGMDSKTVIARFEAERQALSMMDHPNIARVLDVGTTSTGRPFFVMELVKGTPITDFCDQRRLTPRQRLELFVPVCNAIQHAHQKGIIHRDIKPSNVLVALHDDKPVPKVIDFGVAKAIGTPLTERTLHTAFEQVVGTPAYMSPEQATFNQLDIDTRSDVYSLGVLLYELLTGTTPIERERFKQAAILEMLRVVREEEPPRPSTRLSSTEARASIAAVRGTEPARLSKEFRGELDWIAMKALEKDRTRRYETANGLARDVQRFLADEVVEARPPSVRYRVKKFVRRHKGQVFAASLIFLALIGGILGTSWQWFRAESHRQVAVDNAKKAQESAAAEKQARVEADLEKRKAEDSADELVAAVGPHQVANGYRDLETGNFYHALGWFAKSLQGEGANSARAEMHRRRLSNYWRLPQDASATRYLPVQSLQHQGAVTRAVFSRDGRRVVTASEDKTAQVWDAATGQAVGTPLRHARELNYAEFSPDGRWVITASGEYGQPGEARIWDAATGQAVGSALRHTGPVWHAAFSPDGQRVVTTATKEGDQKGGILSGEARIWEAATARPISPLLEHSIEVKHAEFSRDSQRVVTATWWGVGPTGEARVWDAATGKPLGRPLLHDRAGVRRAEFSPDGGRILTASEDGIARVWDAANGKQVGVAVRGLHATFSPDGSRIVTAGASSRAAQVWNAATGMAITPPLRHNEWVHFAAFSPDGLRVVSASSDNTARVWDAASGEPVGPPLQHQAEVTYAVFSPDGRRVVTASHDKTARVWEVAMGQPLGPTVRHTVHWVARAAFSSDGRFVATAGGDRTARVWNAKTGAPVTPWLQHPHCVDNIAFSPDGRRIVTACRNSHAQVWNAETGEKLSPRLEMDAQVGFAAFSRDGQRILTGDWQGRVRVWDAADWRPLGPLLQGTNQVAKGQGNAAAGFSPDGRLFITTNGSIAQVCDAATGKPAGPRLQHEGTVEYTVFSPDGRRLLTAVGRTAQIWDAVTGKAEGLPLQQPGTVHQAAFSPDGGRAVVVSGTSARVWDLGTGQALGPPLKHSSSVSAVFSADGRRVVTASQDNTARVWDAATGQPLGPSFQHRGGVHNAEFSPDGRRVLTACRDGTARIWDVSSDERPAEDWVRLTRFFAGEMDRFGGHTPLSPARMAEDWNYLRTKYPQDFTVTSAQTVAWHQREAEASAAEGNWQAALFHLTIFEKLATEFPLVFAHRAELPSTSYYNFACVYAIASGKVADKKQEYADRSMELLHKAVKAGYTDAAHMAKDKDLDPLRGRADFKKLLDTLRPNPKTKEPAREIAPPPRGVG